MPIVPKTRTFSFFDNFKPLPKNITAYRHFARSIQLLVCLVRPDVIQAIAK